MTLTVSDVLKTGNLDLIKNLGIEQVEKLWNTLQVKGINGLSENETAIKRKCIEVLEVLYRKPWDETIFFKMIQMRLDLGFSELTSAKRLFSEFEMTCPFLPKIHLKRALELKGEFAILKVKDALINTKSNIDGLVTELIEVLVEYKKKGFSINLIGSKILDLMKSIEKSFDFGKQLEALIPECEEFTEFQVDLLNILTEKTLNRAGNCRRNVEFSELITDAINLNVKSLNLKPNVMGYFEFLKITKLQDPRDFTQAIETCLATIKNKIAPGEDVRGKLQIIRLIVNEGKSLKKGLDFAIELFSNCDFNTTIVLDDLLCLIEESDGNNSNLQAEIESFLIKFVDQIRLNKKVQRGVLETLLRLAEKNSTVKENYLRCEEILKVIQGLNLNFTEDEDEAIKIKLVKCYLKLDKLTEAKVELNDQDHDSREWCLLRLEAALRSQDEFTALQMIENLSSDPTIKAEHFLALFNELKVRLDAEMKMKLLKAAQEKDSEKNCGRQTVNIIRGIISLVYDGVIESGLTDEYKQELESCFNSMSNDLTNDQVVWLCQVCWNLGVIHARAEDFLSAQFGFKWCQYFSQLSVEAKKEFGYKAGFYYLTAKVCGSEGMTDEDYEILRQCELVTRSSALMCLKIEMLLRSRNWPELSEVLRRTDIKFESLAEIVLRTSEEVPLEIYRLVLDKLTENEFESESFDIVRFAGLYRGLTTCALLQFPNDLGHFHAAVKMIKSSFGRYPCEETTWLCSTALEMGRQAAENEGEWDKAGEWTEMAMNLVYLIPTDSEEDKIMRSSLQESIQKLFERVVNRN